MASEIRVNKINSRTGVGTITLSPTGVDFTGIATVATLKATTGIVTTLSVTGTTTLNGNLDLQDNDKILIGTGDDLEIYHDGSNSYIKEDGTGSLKIQGTNLHIESAAGEAFVMCTADGAVDLYYDNSKKLETKSDGVDITGELQCDTLDVDGNIDLDGSKITFDSGGNVLKWADNVAAYFGDGNDLRIYHDGSNSWITDNGTGSLKIRSTDGSVQILGTTSNDNMAVFTVDGASELYYDNSKKFETLTNGTQTTGRIHINGTNGAIDYNNTAHTLEYIVNGSAHSELNTGAYVPATNGGKNLGSSNTRWGTVYTNGILFNGDTAAANTLDDYEEGTWTAALNTVNNNATISASNTTGYYVKVGSMVHVHYYTEAATVTSAGTSSAVLTGLPFTVATLSSGYAVATVTHTTIFTGQVQNGYAGPTQSRIVFVGEGNTSSMSYQTGSNKYLMVSLTYRAA